MTNTESRPADVTELWRRLDLITPMALRVAATLRIADLIAAGHTRLAELSARAGVHDEALQKRGGACWLRPGWPIVAK